MMSRIQIIMFFSPKDSPKHRAKGQKLGNKSRAAINLRRQSTSGTDRRAFSTRDANSNQSTTGTLVVVNKGTSKEATVEQDPDILRLKVSFHNLYFH